MTKLAVISGVLAWAPNNQTMVSYAKHFKERYCIVLIQTLWHPEAVENAAL